MLPLFKEIFLNSQYADLILLIHLYVNATVSEIVGKMYSYLTIIKCFSIVQKDMV